MFVTPEGCPTAETANEPISARLRAARIAANVTTPILTTNPRHPDLNRLLSNDAPRRILPRNYTLPPWVRPEDAGT
jgi:hypothetical protein